MIKYLKSKWFIMSTLCIIIAAICVILSTSNILKNNKTAAAANLAQNVEADNDSKNKSYYETFNSEMSWVKDPREPKNLLQVTKDNAIIKVKVESIGETLFFDKTANFNAPYPYTPVKVKVESSIDGHDLENIDTVYLRGGDVKVCDLMKTLDQVTIQKMGLDTLSKEQQETMYVSYKSDYDYHLKPDEECVLIVAKNLNNIYTVVGNGYGIFKEDENTKNTATISSETILKNVLTKKELTDEKGTVLKLKKF